MVICRLGMTAYSVGTAANNCCYSKTVLPITCAFTNCSWRYDGLKVNGVQMLSPWYQAGDRYERVKETYNMAVWEKLVLTTRDVVNEPNRFEAESECSVCYESISTTDRAVTKCAYRFHTSCLTAWTRNHDSCPMCRTTV